MRPRPLGELVAGPAPSLPTVSHGWESRWEGIGLALAPPWSSLPDCRVDGEGGSLFQGPWDSGVATSALSALSAKTPQHCEAKL